MANPDIGSIPCGQCGTTAAVRKNRNSGLYYSCPRCGLIMPRLKAGQEYILERATMYGPEGKPDPIDPAPTDPAAPPAPAESEIPRGQGGRFNFETIL